MLATGTINTQARTFDILGVNETQTSISIINGSLRLTYTSPAGKLVQLVKQLDGTDAIKISDKIGLSPVQENGVGGFAHKTTQHAVAKALAPVNWNNTGNLTTRTFVDSNGLNRTAVLLPVTMI